MLICCVVFCCVVVKRGMRQSGEEKEKGRCG